MKIQGIGQYLNLPCGKNKGFVLSLDALIAVIIAVIAMAASSVYVSMSSGEPMAGLQLSRTGYDLLNIINYKNIWANPSAIETELSALLPLTYSMIIKEQCSGSWINLAKSNTETFDLPAKKEIVSGERVIVNGNSNCRVRFYIWLK